MTELEQLFTVSPDGMLVLRFPALNVDSEESSGVAGGQFWTMRIGEDGAPQWAESDENPRVEVGDFVAAVSIDDAFGAVGKTRLKEQLGAALKEPQLANFFRQQLGLQDDAFELLDVDENEKLDDREFQSVWRWLTARQGARMLARWMTSARPWFQMLDRDGDRRLNAVELAEGAARMGALDRDGDGLLTPSELPLLVRVEVERTDSRLNVGPFGTPMQTQNEEMPSDWVGAMDTNGDGLISPVEFLGDSEDFGGFDTNKDGFLSRQEVYEAD